MIDINLINHIMRSIETDEDNSLTTINTVIKYGTIMINDEYCMYIKASDSSTKEVLVDIAMTVSMFDKVRYSVKQHLIDLLVQPS